MNAHKQVIESIRSSFSLSEEVNIGGFRPKDILPVELEIPALECFMSPEPDVESPDDHGQSIGSPAQSIVRLGSYRSMGSPGLITLYSANLTRFFWRLAIDIDRALSGLRWYADDLEALSEWVVDKTYWHERVHHSMDVLRHLFDVQSFDCVQEEALAVAYARYYLADEYPRYRYLQKNQQSVIWDEFLKQAFQYKSPGYKDWHLYADPEALKSGICDYLAPKHSRRLRSVRVPVADMLFELLPVEGGFEEQVK